MESKWAPGNWVRVVGHVVSYWRLAGEGPWQIKVLDAENGQVDIAVQHSRGDRFLLWVKLENCIACDPPRVSLAEKERKALEAEPWRKHRDANLSAVFRPPPREPRVEPESVAAESSSVATVSMGGVEWTIDADGKIHYVFPR